MPGLAWFSELIQSIYYVPRDTRPSFVGRNVVVTGANVGLGFESAVKFVELGAERVILGVRSLKKGEDAKAKIEARTGRQNVVEVWHLDMLDYQSLKDFARRAEKEMEHLDIAVLNAGVMAGAFEKSQYGWEKTLQVDTLSTVLLSLLLLPKLKASKTSDYTPVLELVGSGNHYHANLREEARKAESPLEVYNQPAGYLSIDQYSLAKLYLMYAQTAMVKEMNRASEAKSPVEVVVVCPGATQSDITRDYTQWYMRIAVRLFELCIAKTTEQGARIYISGATLGGKGHGKFWTMDRIKEPAPLLVGAENEHLQEKVWHDILKALRKDVPELDEVLLST